MRRAALALMLAMVATAAAARAPETSIRPQPRPAATALAETAPAAGETTARDALSLAAAALAQIEGERVARDALNALVPEALPAPDPSLPDRARRPPPSRAAAPEVTRATTPALSLPAQGLASSLRPRPRPEGIGRRSNPAAAVPVLQVAAGAASAQAVARSIRPLPRPENLRRRNVVRASAMIPVPDPQGPRGRAGSVCGDPAIRGESISRIASRVQGCGVEEPVRVTEVDGVRLSTAITVDCPTAIALRRWVSDTVRPQVGRLGGGVQSLQVLAHYACRPRNNQRGARISEHGRGRAVDIGAINLANGSSIPVLGNWRGQHGDLMRALHRGACGPFGTVLGPASDRYHANHFHFDTARHRSGPYCR